MNKLAFIPQSLFITLLAIMMCGSASASGCLEPDSDHVKNKTDSKPKSDLAQMIKCLSEELASFEKINQELRVKVSELEKNVFEGFDSNLPEQSMRTFKQVETNVSDALDEKLSNKMATGVDSNSDSDPVEVKNSF